MIFPDYGKVWTKRNVWLSELNTRIYLNPNIVFIIDIKGFRELFIGVWTFDSEILKPVERAVVKIQTGIASDPYKTFWIPVNAIIYPLRQSIIYREVIEIEVLTPTIGYTTNQNKQHKSDWLIHFLLWMIVCQGFWG